MTVDYQQRVCRLKPSRLVIKSRWERRMLTPDNGINMWREAQPHTQVSKEYHLLILSIKIYVGLTKEGAS